MIIGTYIFYLCFPVRRVEKVHSSGSNVGQGDAGQAGSGRNPSAGSPVDEREEDPTGRRCRSSLIRDQSMCQFFYICCIVCMQKTSAKF